MNFVIDKLALIYTYSHNFFFEKIMFFVIQKLFFPTISRNILHKNKISSLDNFVLYSMGNTITKSPNNFDGNLCFNGINSLRGSDAIYLW